jgi:hypothetical protein
MRVCGKSVRDFLGEDVLQEIVPFLGLEVKRKQKEEQEQKKKDENAKKSWQQVAEEVRENVHTEDKFALGGKRKIEDLTGDDDLLCLEDFDFEN